MLKWIIENIRPFFGFHKCYLASGNKKKEFYLRVKWFFQLLFEGVAAKDFFTYHFDEKKYKDRKKFVTMLYGKWIIYTLNRKGKREIVENKAVFANVFKKYLKRNVVVCNDLSYDEFKRFYIEEENIILKPICGCNGNGILVMRKDLTEKQIKEIFNNIENANYIAETLLQQEGFLYDLNPFSLNTIRINVLNNHGNIRIVNACLRVGNGERCVDNLSSGGIGAGINVETGIIETPFRDKGGHTYIEHPYSHIGVIGRAIPYWYKVKVIVNEVVGLMPDVPYTSWDIAIVKGNDIAIVEGNTYGNFHNQQMFYQCGVKEVYKKFVKEYNK